MRKKFGETIVKIAKKDPKVVLLTGDVEQEMEEYKELFPDRFFNLGLCEQAITSMAAGLAIEGCALLFILLLLLFLKDLMSKLK